MLICSAARTQSRRGLGCGRVGWRRAGWRGGRFRLGVGTLHVKWALRRHAPLHQQATRANAAARTHHFTRLGRRLALLSRTRACVHPPPPPPVQSGHVSSLPLYRSDMSRPFPRTNWPRRAASPRLRSSALRGASGQVGHQIAQPTLLPSLHGRGRWFFTVPQLSRELRCVPCLPHAALETRALGPLEQALRRRAAGRHARRGAHTCPRTAN